MGVRTLHILLRIRPPDLKDIEVLEIPLFPFPAHRSGVRKSLIQVMVIRYWIVIKGISPSIWKFEHWFVLEGNKQSKKSSTNRFSAL